MNFLLTEMTFLRYYMPLIIEANKRDIECNVFVKKNSKYNDPMSHINILKAHQKNHKFKIHQLNKVNEFPGLTFLVEGVNAEQLEKKHHKVSITALCDYRILYPKYVNVVDNIIFPSEKYATFYSAISPKNLYLGSPKYDVILDKEQICKQYNIPMDKKIATFMLPKVRDRKLLNTKRVIDLLRDMGYCVITKTRGKDPVTVKLHGDFHFKDTNWFPHTSMELIFIGDIMINTCSGAIKEAVMLRKPILNFIIKPRQTPQFLYDEDCCLNITPKFTEESLKDDIATLLAKDLDAAFDKAIEENLNQVSGNDSKKILDYFQNKGII